MVDILYEDKDIIVVIKPYGVASQTERGSGQDMVSILMNYFYEKGEKNPYVGVVHRLDKNVSGVMVYAKNKNAAGKLCAGVAGRNTEKRYYAAFYPEKDMPGEGILRDFLVRDGRTNTSRVVPEGTKDGREAVLNYKVISQSEFEGQKIAFADVELVTGRHHQIRVQFASRGCALLGDRKYGKPDGQRNVGLYCYMMGFEHPTTGKKVSFTSKPDTGIFANM